MAYLVKRPVAFRVQRADPNGGLSGEWQLFNDEKAAHDEAEAKGIDYQALFVRDGTAIVAEWEPIETAPKDGTKVDLWHPTKGRLTDAFFHKQTYTLYEPWGWGNQSWGRITGATHWMPQPAPPLDEIQQVKNWIYNPESRPIP